ncbi:MAG: hypothetical protein ACLRTA_04120 [Clostridia bacterium]
MPPSFFKKILDPFADPGAVLAGFQKDGLDFKVLFIGLMLPRTGQSHRIQQPVWRSGNAVGAGKLESDLAEVFLAV